LLVDAGCLAGTFYIRSATNLCSATTRSFGALEPGWTLAVNFVISYNTLGGFLTRVLNRTWRYTVVVIAGLV